MCLLSHSLVITPTCQSKVTRYANTIMCIDSYKIAMQNYSYTVYFWSCSTCIVHCETQVNVHTCLNWVSTYESNEPMGQIDGPCLQFSSSIAWTVIIRALQNALSHASLTCASFRWYWWTEEHKEMCWSLTSWWYASCRAGMGEHQCANGGPLYL